MTHFLSTSSLFGVDVVSDLLSVLEHWFVVASGVPPDSPTRNGKK